MWATAAAASAATITTTTTTHAACVSTTTTRHNLHRRERNLRPHPRRGGGDHFQARPQQLMHRGDEASQEGHPCAVVAFVVG
jgi:hypothetical protein